MALTLTFLGGLSAFSASATPLSVSGLADIWLAGQANGSTVTGTFGSDVATVNSPVVLSVVAGHSLTFSVTGITSLDNGNCFALSPDGGCVANVAIFGAGPANGLSSFTGPGDALIGVFVNGNIPSGPGSPAGLDFTIAGSTTFASLSPLLNQVFFIGDGLTGTGSGAVQQFIVPGGATRLFLGSSDALGANFDNAGSFTVNVSDASTSAAPEPAAYTLIGAGILGLLLRSRPRAIRIAARW